MDGETSSSQGPISFPRVFAVEQRHLTRVGPSQVSFFLHLFAAVESNGRYQADWADTNGHRKEIKLQIWVHVIKALI